MILDFDMRQFCDAYAEPEDMRRWAGMIMKRPPDFKIQGESGLGDYLHRWYVIPRNEHMNVYLHHMLRSDKDVPHDHPWANTSLIIGGRYVEQTLDGHNVVRRPGDIVHRAAADAHRLILYKGETAMSLFFTGPKTRDWGFHCPKGWVSWQDFTGGVHSGRGNIGRGCGEMA